MKNPEPTMSNALQVEQVSFSYGDRLVLDKVSLQVGEGEVFCLLGPNGSGKSTLFRILSTALPLAQGRALVAGHDLATCARAVRTRLGVLFQHPSLDGKLTVIENLRCGGHMFGLHGKALEQRIKVVSGLVQIEERWKDRVETLSGGLKRRVEIAKALLPSPQLLLLDEPSTGLDPGIRLQLWNALVELRQSQDLTVVFTTHLMDEADRADRVAIMHHGRIVAEGQPAALCRALGDNILSLDFGAESLSLLPEIQSVFSPEAKLVDGKIHLELQEPHEMSVKLAGHYGSRLRAMTVSQPTLEDVFIHHTGVSLTAASESGEVNQQ